MTSRSARRDERCGVCHLKHYVSALCNEKVAKHFRLMSLPRHASQMPARTGAVAARGPDRVTVIRYCKRFRPRGWGGPLPAGPPQLLLSGIPNEFVTSPFRPMTVDDVQWLAVRCRKSQLPAAAAMTRMAAQ